MEISVRKQRGVCIASVMMGGRRYDLARASSVAVAHREAEIKLQGILESAVARSNPSHYSRRDAMRIFAAANNGRVEKGSGEYIDQHGRSAHVATEALRRAWEARQKETRPAPRSNPSWGVDVASGKPLPRSFWDGPRESSPFTWATPAPNIDGSFPEPWRNPNAERALNWIIRTRILDDIIESPREIVTDEYSDVNGRRAIWLGFRDNRDNTKIERAFAELKRRKVPVKAINMGGKLSSILLVDDLPSHPFR